MSCCVRVGIRSVVGLEGSSHFFAEVEVLPTTHHEEVLRVLFNELALVVHE